jgi:hypothetical protein
VSDHSPASDPVAAPLRRLIYRSRSRLGGGAAAMGAEIGRILETARHRNECLGVTGALVVRGARFAQALEGPSQAVQALFDSIAADPRHDQITTVEDGPVAARAFPGWSMAYVGEAGAPDIPLTLADAGRPVDDEQDHVLQRLRALAG